MAEAPEPRSAARWLRHLRPHNPSSTIYGTILAAALVATEGATSASLAEVVASVLATLIIYWLAHAYSDMVAEPVVSAQGERNRPSLRSAYRSLQEHRGIVSGGLGLVVVLLVVGLAGAGEQTAVNAALTVSIAELFAWGIVAAKHAKLTGGWVIVNALGSAAFGVVIVLLKAGLR